jgi:hypothetical protein
MPKEKKSTPNRASPLRKVGRCLFHRIVQFLKIDRSRVDGPSLIRSYAPDRPTAKRFKAPMSVVQFTGTGTRTIENAKANAPQTLVRTSGKPRAPSTGSPRTKPSSR